MLTENSKRTYAEVCSLILVSILTFVFWYYFGPEIALVYFVTWYLLKCALECPANQQSAQRNCECNLKDK